jgi:hypothetical protein
MYGWAWTLLLAAELKTLDTEEAKRWSAHFKPIESKIVELVLVFIPRLDWPIRSGTHSDTGFALALILDYARAVGNSTLVSLVSERVLHYYRNDLNYPVSYEPSGNDFSPRD